jgi:serine/threonine protein kinase
LASGLLSQEQLDEAWGQLCAASPFPNAPPGDEQLAQKLVELGRLNIWQGKQLLDGRTKFNLGPYRIIDSLGRGGMGQVFKGEHGILGRVVAIKVLPLSKSTPEAVASFMREIRAQARLDHENLVRALDAGEDGNVYYLVTEFVPGTDLRKLVRREGPLNMPVAASIVCQVAAGLQYAHEQGLIHRDVKPGNVLVTPEWHAKLSDLGLAGPLGGDASEDPRFGKIVGTADYLSPDHITAPWDPKPAWDIYSLGCTLYYAVTGKVPFPFMSTTAEKAKAHCELQPLDPRLLNAALESGFVEAIADMMAKNPAQRIPTAIDVIARLTPWTDMAASGPLGLSGRGRVASVSRWSQSDGEAGSRGGAASKPAGGGEGELQDTQPSSPGFAEFSVNGNAPREMPARSQRESPPEAASPVLEPVAVWRPLLVLVLLPIALVWLLMLIWWGAKFLR